MKFILAKKSHMTQFFNEEGIVFPATVLEVAPITVTQVRTLEKDGYKAVQIGSALLKRKNISKPERGHLKEVKATTLREFKPKDVDQYQVGTIVDATVFAKGDVIAISGVSKGKGFQGVVKRHGFKGGPRTHGQKHSEREAGTIGGGLRTRVPKGMRMAGRMGTDRVTVKNLIVLDVDTSLGTMLVKGAVPGKRGTLLEIRG